jgi:hypothetical protein
LLGLYPILYLWSANRAQQQAYVVLPGLLATLAGVLLVYLLATALLRNIQRAALVATLLSFYVLTYGHFTALAEKINLRLDSRYFLPGSALVTLALLAALVILKAGRPALTRLLNIVSIALVLLQLVTAAPYYLAMSGTSRVQARAENTGEMVPSTNGKPQRDVYFILIDNYGREDVLQSAFGFDNSQIVGELKERGFVFPQCAQANYYHTAPAIASILNLEYLDKLGIQSSVFETRSGYSKMVPLFQDSEVIRKFRAYGYHVVTFRGFMGMIDIQNTDTYISFEKDTAYHQRLETANFNSLYYKTTVFNGANELYRIYPELLASKGPGFLKPLLPKEQVLEERFQKVFDQNLYAFEALERIPTRIEGPKFVYAHLYSAHWPFMHHPDGSVRLPFSEKMTTEGYVEGVQFTNNRLLAVIDSILENSEVEPVIILQGDHNNGWVGRVEWSGKDRIKILSAYYLPDGGEALLREDITPLNNFRLVFKHYFGEPLELLPDVSYYLDPQTKKTKLAPKTCIGDEPIR